MESVLSRVSYAIGIKLAKSKYYPIHVSFLWMVRFMALFVCLISIKLTKPPVDFFFKRDFKTGMSEINGLQNIGKIFRVKEYKNIVDKSFA